ncbi:succinylglutamate desuccinylase [Glaciecola sp. MH2013]|uniref:succinylglutamate desuccinylase n=1 Tax=Glaciecola sp. MH2013 TaxID=2785524 RepID=UPI0018A05FCA|nr:succinylglutamate desuccinylase [Glaciecola sp. MH2013]MBF7072986.1 succinylglutamate desuccinylase [Glaciecola sp. MH2013]
MNFKKDNFLSLSRDRAGQFSNETEFTINSHTRVKIWCRGIISFEPLGLDANKKVKSILLSCGLHGNETAPIEICDALVDDLINAKIQTSHRLMVIFGNLEAMDIAERFVEENLNRLFDAGIKTADECENIEQHRAQAIKRCVDEFFAVDENKPTNHDNSQRFHYDLHTAIRESKNEKFAVYPFLHGEAINTEQLRFLSLCDVNTILLSQSPTTTFSYYTSRYYNAHSFTVELGKVMPFGENQMSKFSAADRALRALVEHNTMDLPSWSDCPIEVFEVKQVINKKTHAFALNFADDLPNFSAFEEGELIASDGDINYKATQHGEAIVFPNAKVEIGQRAILTVVPCNVE